MQFNTSAAQCRLLWSVVFIFIVAFLDELNQHKPYPRERKSKRRKNKTKRWKIEKKPLYYGWVELLPRGRIGNNLFVFYLRARDLKTELQFYYCTLHRSNAFFEDQYAPHSVTRLGLSYEIYLLCSSYHPNGRQLVLCVIVRYIELRYCQISRSDVEPADFRLIVYNVILISYDNVRAGGRSVVFFFFFLIATLRCRIASVSQHRVQNELPDFIGFFSLEMAEQ